MNKVMALIVLTCLLALSSVAIAEEAATTITTTTKTYITAVPAKVSEPKVKMLGPVNLGAYKNEYGCLKKEMWCDILQKCLVSSVEKCATPPGTIARWNKGEAPAPVWIKQVEGLAKLDKPLVYDNHAIHSRVREDKPNLYRLPYKRQLNVFGVPITKTS